MSLTKAPHAAWAAPTLGPLFVATARGPGKHFLLEARVRGALPVLRWPPPGPDPGLPAAAILVVRDEDTARAVPAPIAATWPAARVSRS